MEKNFKELYQELVNEYGEKYKPQKRKITTKKLLYVLFLWIIFGFIETLLKTFDLSNTIIYMLIQMFSSLSFILLIVFALFIMNTNMNYWKMASEFKREVGKAFFKKINSNISYISDRSEINNEIIKKDLNDIYENSNVLVIEDYLEYQDVKISTIKFDNTDKKRLTGSLVIINNCNKKIEENFLENLNLENYGEIINLCQKDGKLYLFFDAKEIFYYSSRNFFDEKELESNYKFFCDILKIKNNIL